jgi:hypothetical protein
MEVAEGMAVLETGAAEEEGGRKAEVSRRDSSKYICCDHRYGSS